MLRIRHSQERGRTQLPWLDGRHSFSFGNYYDPAHMGFGPLRVINEDVIAPGGGFPTHGHANMEIITVVLSGALAHRDSLGNGSTIRPGEVQRMSAGSGIEHSEFNASKTEPVRLLQIWIQPDKSNLKPSYDQKSFPFDEQDGQALKLVVSSDAREGSIAIHQDAALYFGHLKAGQSINRKLTSARRSWIQVASGAVEVNNQRLSSGDAAAIENEDLLQLRAETESQILVFDLP